MGDDSAKQDVKRYVYTQAHVLAKHKGKPPSLRVYLHPKHFRLNDSQETLSYASPMRELLDAIRARRVPHNMIDDFDAVGIPWYDNCLIVEIHDHRGGQAKPKDDAGSTGDGAGTNAFSIHNYNNFITPSPHVPYPSTKPGAKPGQPDAQPKDADHAREDKENMAAPGHASQKQPNVITVVLFPTPQSHLADMQLLATTPVPDAASMKRMQAAGRLPQTPLTAVPPTPTFPSAKRQKMVIDDSNLHEFEAEVYNATCPKLFLEPTKNFGESLALIEAFTHPNNQNPPPVRKTRKRTTAELAADEAEAANLQRFMLAGDEHQASMVATATGADEGAARAAANSQTFSRFKTIASIRASHEEADRRKKEEDARIAQNKRQAQIEAEVQKRREQEANRQQAEIVERQQQLLRQQQHQQQQLQQNQLQQNQLQQNEALRAATQAQQMAHTTAVQQLSQTGQAGNQSQFSPVIRQQTPMTAAAASPHVGGQAPHPVGGTPMIPTISNQAMNSPARPPSSVSHHPMARTASQQQMQSMSRTGTPQITQGTPVMNAAMPNRNMTPTPRMNGTSPSMVGQGATPLMMQTPQPGQNMTPEQMQQLQQQQQQMHRLRMQQQMQVQTGSPGNAQALQQMAMQKAAQHVQAQGIPQGQDPTVYQRYVASQYYQRLQQQQAAQRQNQVIQAQQLQQPQLQQQQQPMASMSPQSLAQNGMATQQGLNVANMSIAQLRQQYQQRRTQLVQTFGQNVPQMHLQQMSQLEAAIKTKEREAQQQMSQTQMHLNPAMQGQMNGAANNVQNPVQMQQYQQMLQQQRANQARQQQINAMRQQAMLQGGQMPQGMMNNVQGMNMANMQGMNMNNMQGMNMGNMAGMQGMQGMNNGQMTQQQMQQQMMLMRQAQLQAQQRMPQQGQQGGGGDMGWSGV